MKGTCVGPGLFLLLTVVCPPAVFAEPAIPPEGAAVGKADAGDLRRLAREWRAARPSLRRDAASGSMETYYFLSYKLDALLAACEATHDEEMARFLIGCARSMMAAGKDRDGDGFLDYAGEKNISQRWKGWRPVARLARVLKAGFHEKEFEAPADGILAFVEKHVIGKSRKEFEAASRRDFAGETAHIVANLGEILVDAYIATGKKEYRALAERYARAVVRQMRRVDGAYVWNQVIGDRELRTRLSGTVDGSHVSDTSHGGELISFVEVAYRAGIGFSDVDIAAYIKTVTGNLWRDTGKPLHDFVDGKDWEGSGGPGRWGTHMEIGWLKLGMFSAKVRALADQFRPAGDWEMVFRAYQVRNRRIQTAARWRLAPKVPR